MFLEGQASLLLPHRVGPVELIDSAQVSWCHEGDSVRGLRRMSKARTTCSVSVIPQKVIFERLKRVGLTKETRLVRVACWLPGYLLGKRQDEEPLTIVRTESSGHRVKSLVDELLGLGCKFGG